jgi:flagellar basal body-associated protein FliL
MASASLLILILVFVLILALFAGLVWLFVLLSRGKMQPRQEVQTPPAERVSGKNRKPRR